MASSTFVPVTAARDAGDPATVRMLLRRHGVRRLLADSFVRCRYGDGFSHARALALLLCLAVVPFLIAVTGLAEEAGAEQGGAALARMIVTLSPGRSDAFVRRMLLPEGSGDTGEAALLIGLALGIAAMTAAMGQIERGANRIYGIRRDRPALRKYGWAMVLTLVAGAPAFGGFVMLVGGAASEQILDDVYGWSDPAELAWRLSHWPLSVALTLAAVLVLFRLAPRRRQPTLAWLLPGAALATVLWLAVSLLLAGYVSSALYFSEIYGPLSAVVALLVWANASGGALFFGLACAAQLEAYRAGVSEPCEPDRWHPGTQPRAR